ncbi:MAG TPA: phospholipid carrier-dependent glycosyltransferase [Candidatus Binataceae bacterium]|nr:phospholipid carrier-dependent glycosyltransferase [Candidatus Binataceae bacterium]
MLLENKEPSALARPWRSWLAILLGLIAFAAAAPPGPVTGNFAGLISGVILLAILSYAYATTVRPLSSDMVNAIAILVAIALVKLVLLNLFPGFRVDVGTYESWALQIADHGPAQTYQSGYFLDYPPGYLYMLWVCGLVAHAVNASGDVLDIIVKSPPLIADFALALAIYIYVKRGPRAQFAVLAMLMVALNPALLYDTIVWGQSDSILTLTTILTLIAILAERFELAWAVAALSVLIKPQGLMILPMLALWTMLETPFMTWVSSAAAFIGAFFIGIAPFQIGHEWNWIIKLYTSTAAYYHETSVNAFNLMALIGGLRSNDGDTIGGVSYFALGMSLLIPLYAYIAWIVARTRNAERLFYAAFIAVFGFFMVAPRMHERYVIPAVVLAIPLALESTEMMIVFGLVTVTGCFNLAYVLHTLTTVVFLNGRDGLAMFASVLNVIALGIAVYYGVTLLQAKGGAQEGALLQALRRMGEKAREKAALEVSDNAEPSAPLEWLRVDTIVTAAMLVVAGFTRFWRLATPPEIVFDEVHFVAQARHYLRSESFLDPHPPLAKMVIALGIYLFGDHSWGWRVGNATLGTLLVGITYLLVRRMSRSRLAAGLAALFIMIDGLYLVDSRIGVIDIVYLTCAAFAYWLFFVFVDTSDPRARRRLLIGIGIALGLCLGSKLYIPAITFLLVTGFLIYVVWRDYAAPARESIEDSTIRRTARDSRLAGTLAIVGGVATIAYLATFTLHFTEGYWSGIEDLFHYYGQVIWYENSVSTATHPYSSPWWSWPLMLRPIAYWQNFPASGPVVATIWGGGNPLIWWGALTGITITAVHAIERPSLARWFLVIGYLSYIVIWIPIGRTLFLYHYMASVYLGYVALALVLAGCWEGRGDPFEHSALMLTMFAALLLGLGYIAGMLSALAIVGIYVYLLIYTDYAGKYVAALFVAGAVVLFIYFYPVWTGMPIERSGYYTRMWLQQSGLRNWI